MPPLDAERAVARLLRFLAVEGVTGQEKGDSRHLGRRSAHLLLVEFGEFAHQKDPHAGLHCGEIRQPFSEELREQLEYVPASLIVK